MPSPNEINEYIEDFRERNEISEEKMKNMRDFERKMNDMNIYSTPQPIQNIPLNSPGVGNFGGFNQWASPQNPYIQGGSTNQSPVQNQAFQFYNKPQRSNTVGNPYLNDGNNFHVPGTSHVSKSQLDAYNIALHQAKGVSPTQSTFLANQGFGKFSQGTPGNLPPPGSFGINQQGK